MSGRFAFIALLFLSSTFLWLSCIEDAKSKDYALEGRWELVRGFRNQRETGTLSGTYFQFGSDGKMITNLPVGPEVPMEFELSKAGIRQKGTPPVEYDIRSHTDTSLVLGLTLRSMQFELHLRRADPIVTPTPADSLLKQDSEAPPESGQ